MVVNNNSNDNTKIVAASYGATVLDEKQQGYGFACLKGIRYLNDKTLHPDIVVFIDADFSDHPQQMESLIVPIIHQQKQMVIGSRALGIREKEV